jgi:DNA-binding MarR family transcriptional regulator
MADPGQTPAAGTPDQAAAGTAGQTQAAAGTAPQAQAAAGTPDQATAGTAAQTQAAAAVPGQTGGSPAGPERWLDPAEMAAWLAFLEVSHLLDRKIEQQLRQDAGLSHAQYEILSRLAAAPGAQLRMSELADVIIVSRSGLTYQITQLEKSGLVRRAPCPSDERGILAVLTRAGRAALARAAPGHLRVVREYLIDALTPDQRDTLTGALATARTRLRPARTPDHS